MKKKDIKTDVRSRLDEIRRIARERRAAVIWGEPPLATESEDELRARRDADAEEAPEDFQDLGERDLVSAFDDLIKKGRSK